MSIFNSLKGKKKRFTEEQLDKLYDKSQNLIKQSTKYKDSDIQKSIDLIHKAIDIYPYKILDHYFKLANYYHKAGQKGKAYKILHSLIEEENSDNIFNYQLNISKIFEKLNVLFYRDKEYEEYIRNSLLSKYYFILSQACSAVGDVDFLKDDYSFLFSLSDKSKLGRCFKYIKKENQKIEIENLLQEFYNSIKEKLIKMSEISSDIDYNSTLDEIYDNEANPQDIQYTEGYALKHNSEFMALYNDLNKNYIEKYIEDKIAPLLV